jgi:uncharacterized protein
MSVSTTPPNVEGKDPVRGQIVRQQVIPACQYGAFEVARGEVIRIVDLEGRQVPDVMAHNRHRIKESLSTRYSLSLNGKTSLSTGDTLYSFLCNPLATIVGDTVGRHFWGGNFCSEGLRFRWTGVHGLPNCRDNLVAALTSYGLLADDIRDGGCLNPFMNYQVGDDRSRDGLVRIGPAFSQAGDYFELRAEEDLVVAISACPDDTSAVNDHTPTAIGVVVYRAAA